VKCTCPCRRLKKEFPCDALRRGLAKVDCDDVCKQKKEEEIKKKEEETLRKQLEEERRNQEEVERFQKKFQARKKYRERRQYEEIDSRSFLTHYWWLLVGVLGLLLALYYKVFL
jgi:NF-X1-type zinc finger protein NFXL1